MNTFLKFNTFKIDRLYCENHFLKQESVVKEIETKINNLRLTFFFLRNVNQYFKTC